MRYIASKLNDSGDYKLIGIETMKTPDGKDVEVIWGDAVENKEKLEEIINDFKEETAFFLKQQTKEFREMREKNLKEYKLRLNAVKNCK